MIHSARIGYGTATELADVIVQESGLSFRMAHNIVALVVSNAIAEGRRADEITAAEVAEVGEELFGRRVEIDERTLQAALDPRENVVRRAIAGGPAPAVVAEMIERRVEALAADRAEIEALAERVRERRASALAAARALARPRT